jgi:signal transduction histidine kinase
VNIYRQKFIWKLLLIIIAVIIGVGSLFYTNRLVDQLKVEEQKKIELWAEATRLVVNEVDDDVLNFLVAIIEENSTVPAILTDEAGNITSSVNIDSTRVDDISYLTDQLNRMRDKGEVIEFSFGDSDKNYIYYRDSTILTKLTYYPYIQLGVIVIFIFISYFAFSMARKAEQNQVWVGMSKETAHQLGTPTSSLSGWAELLKLKLPDSSLPEELTKDIGRLEKITDRFSKIGSKPELKEESLIEVISTTLDYLKSRSSSKVEFLIVDNSKGGTSVLLNASLFEWVLENIIKNSVDAMNGIGKVTITLSKGHNSLLLDIEDTGKGIPKSAWKTVFKPGYTTKQRGWGLGLSLSKRIVEIYHRGKIFVKSTESGHGACFRIVIPTGLS